MLTIPGPRSRFCDGISRRCCSNQPRYNAAIMSDELPCSAAGNVTHVQVALRVGGNGVGPVALPWEGALVWQSSPCT
jgi:hypothetical protein